MVNNRVTRDVSISIARFLAMIMIISCHMFSYYDNELAHWLNVGVQIFLVISGFLYGTKDISSPIVFLKRNFRKIIIPYWLFLVLAIAGYLLFCPMDLSISAIIRAFTCSGTIKGLGHLWFVGYILFCYLITPYLYGLRKYTEKLPLSTTFLIYCGLFIAIQLMGFLFDSYFAPDRVSCFVSGFFLADLFKRFSPGQALLLKVVIVLFAFVINGAEVFVKYYSQITFVGWQDLVFRALCRYSHLLLGLAIFLLLYGRFRKGEYCIIWRLSDKYSYPIYLVHQLFILSPLTLMSITDINAINWLVVVIAIIFSGVLLYHLAKWAEAFLFQVERKR